MAKFKVGDRVRIREDLKAGVYKCNKPDCCLGGMGTDEDMVKFAGRICTIHELTAHDNYYLVGCGEYIFTDDMLEDQVVFTKADLKDGMIVEVVDGDKYIVLPDILTSTYSFLRLSGYNNELEYTGTTGKRRKDLDIVKIYNRKEPHCLHVIFRDDLTLIWERKKEEPVKEMTVEEIEKILGHKVKVIADEK